MKINYKKLVYILFVGFIILIVSASLLMVLSIAYFQLATEGPRMMVEVVSLWFCPVIYRFLFLFFKAEKRLWKFRQSWLLFNPRQQKESALIPIASPSLSLSTFVSLNPLTKHASNNEEALDELNPSHVFKPCPLFSQTVYAESFQFHANVSLPYPPQPFSPFPL